MTLLAERYVFDGKGGASLADTAMDQIDPESIRWWDVDVGAGASVARDLEREIALPDVVVDTLFADETRPRSMTIDDGLMVILRGVNTNPGADPEDMVSIRIWLQRNTIITTHRRRLVSIADLKQALSSGRGPTTVGGFLVILIERLADRIGHFVDQIEEKIGTVEEALNDDGLDHLRQDLSAIRRQVASVRRFLAPQRDALDRMYRQPGGLLAEDEAHQLREETDRITRYLEDLDLARERAIVLQEELLAQLAQEQNTRMYVLSIVAAVFLPLTFITGLLGMNVGGLPGVDNPRGFLISLIVMLLAGIALAVFLRWKKWF